MKFAFLFLPLVCAFAGLAHATPVPAERADDFVDSIGVCTHWSYYDTPYGDFSRASALLGELGVRHIRDGLHPRERELFDRYGIKTTAGFVPQSGDIGAQLQSIKDSLPFLDMVEGPNEVDIFAVNASYKGQVFPEGARLYQNDLFAALKSDPTTASLGVVVTSTAHAGANAQLAPLNSFDFRVMHSYAGGQKPSVSLESEVNNNIRNSARIQGPNTVLKPIVVTESGYHNALGADLTLGGVQPGIPEATGTKYFPRHFAEYFNAGIRRTFTYEFLNEFPDEQTNAEANFGLVHRDFTPKPAYTAIKNLIARLSEAKWNPATKMWDKPNPGFAPRSLNFDITGDAKDIHSTLLQKADGDFYLLLWHEVSSFDIETRKSVETPPANVTINIAQSADVSAFRVSDNQTLLTPEDKLKKKAPLLGNVPLISYSKPSTPILGELPIIGDLFNSHTTLSVQVPDEVIILKITPKPPHLYRLFINPPINVSATTTGTTAKLSWERSDENIIGYFVSRLGQELGFVRQPPVADPIFTDDKLDPAQGYTYSVRAVNREGDISRPTTIVAMTKSEMPDLVVTHLALVAGEDGIGNEAHFEATIENRGNAPTPTETTHGVAFSVDGEFLAWSDSFRGPLTPGASVVVRSNSGPKGTATWRVLAGKHTLRAQIDDVNRINESNENNNVLEVALNK